MSGTCLLRFWNKSVRRREVTSEFVRPSITFARRLREIRDDRRPKITQEALAKRLMKLMGVVTDDPSKVETYRVMVSRTESGRRAPTVDDLILFATALEVPPGELLGGRLGLWGESTEALERRLAEQEEEIKQRFADLETNFAEFLRRRKEMTNDG
jgi:transcriptional regulator with XRE-family HTH domain